MVTRELGGKEGWSEGTREYLWRTDGGRQEMMKSGIDERRERKIIYGEL